MILAACCRCSRRPWFCARRTRRSPSCSSLVPTATPFLMLLRLAMTPGPPLWQVRLSVALTLGTARSFVWAAGRIFRVGLLMQGKPPNLPNCSAGFGNRRGRSPRFRCRRHRRRRRPRRRRGRAHPRGGRASTRCSSIAPTFPRNKPCGGGDHARASDAAFRGSSAALDGHRRPPRSPRLHLEGPDGTALELDAATRASCSCAASSSITRSCSEARPRRRASRDERFEITQAEWTMTGRHAAVARRPPSVGARWSLPPTACTASSRKRLGVNAQWPPRESRHRHDGRDADRDAARAAAPTCCGSPTRTKASTATRTFSRRRITSTSASAACCRTSMTKSPSSRTSCRRSFVSSLVESGRAARPLRSPAVHAVS